MTRTIFFVLLVGVAITASKGLGDEKRGEAEDAERQRARLRAEAVAAGKALKADRLVHLLHQLGAFSGEDGWDAAFRYGREVVTAAGKLGGNKPTIVFEDLKTYPLLVQEKVLRKTFPLHRERIIASLVNPDFGIRECAVVSTGEICVPDNPLVQSLVLSNGDIKVGAQVVGCVIVCDGDVEVGGCVGEAVIVARGIVRVMATWQTASSSPEGKFRSPPSCAGVR